MVKQAIERLLLERTTEVLKLCMEAEPSRANVASLGSRSKMTVELEKFPHFFRII